MASIIIPKVDKNKAAVNLQHPDEHLINKEQMEIEKFLPNKEEENVKQEEPQEPPIPPPETTASPKKRKKPSGELKGWEKEFFSYFKHSLSQGEAKKIIKLMKELQKDPSFSIHRDYEIRYKNQNLGNVFLIMYNLFKDHRTEKRLRKQVYAFKKALLIQDIKIP